MESGPEPTQIKFNCLHYTRGRPGENSKAFKKLFTFISLIHYIMLPSRRYDLKSALALRDNELLRGWVVLSLALLTTKITGLFSIRSGGPHQGR